MYVKTLKKPAPSKAVFSSAIAILLFPPTFTPRSRAMYFGMAFRITPSSSGIFALSVDFLHRRQFSSGITVECVDDFLNPFPFQNHLSKDSVFFSHLPLSQSLSINGGQYGGGTGIRQPLAALTLV
jgi:hypothetical protein